MLATSQDKQRATDKLYEFIRTGTQSAEQVIHHVIQNQPTDELPRGGSLKFEGLVSRDAISVQYPARDGEVVTRTLHRHAIGQMAQTIDMPIKFVDALQETRAPWGRELLAHNLETIFHERHASKKFLTRSVNGQVRGFLSDQYRRIDSRPIVEAFAEEVNKKGALPYEGVTTDTKIAIKAIYPTVYEPIPGEMVAFGLALENSDFGNGAMSVREFMARIWCSNLAVFEESMRQVHMGKRLDENMVYSDRTYQLDADTSVSALRDVVRNRLDAGTLDTRVRALQAANEAGVTPQQAAAQLKKFLNKGEAEDALKAFEGQDEYNLPAGQTAWRLSNAISWIANGKDVAPERKLELSKIAAEVLPGVKKAA